MMKEKTGRVTFMPLNRLKPKVPVFPQTEDTQPLIDQLAFDPKYTKAFQQVFGKTCVCKDLMVAAKYARSHDLNTITIEGDKVDRKGALTGGYHDIRRSRMDGINGYMSWSVKLEEDIKKSHEVKRHISQLEQEITRLSGKLQVSTTQRMQLHDAREPLGQELLTLKKEREAIADQRNRLDKEVTDLSAELRSLATRIAGCEQELASPMTDRLSSEERTLIKELSKQVDQNKGILVELSRRVSEVRLGIKCPARATEFPH
jgi:structural maintenance of chromosome 3 (chondroitin sulfate proteoglycan 6)